MSEAEERRGKLDTVTGLVSAIASVLGLVEAAYFGLRASGSPPSAPAAPTTPSPSPTTLANPVAPGALAHGWAHPLGYGLLMGALILVIAISTMLVSFALDHHEHAIMFVWLIGAECAVGIALIYIDHTSAAPNWILWDWLACASIGVVAGVRRVVRGAGSRRRPRPAARLWRPVHWHGAVAGLGRSATAMRWPRGMVARLAGPVRG
jgi:hypothetical protein